MIRANLDFELSSKYDDYTQLFMTFIPTPHTISLLHVYLRPSFRFMYHVTSAEHLDSI